MYTHAYSIFICRERGTDTTCALDDASGVCDATVTFSRVSRDSFFLRRVRRIKAFHLYTREMCTSNSAIIFWLNCCGFNGDPLLGKVKNLIWFVCIPEQDECNKFTQIYFSCPCRHYTSWNEADWFICICIFCITSTFSSISWPCNFACVA